MNFLFCSILVSFFVVTLVNASKFIYFNASCHDEEVLKLDRALQRSSRSANDKDWLKILKFPNQYDAFQRESALNYARSHYKKIYQSREFIQLNRETLKEILSSDILNVDSEEIVFDSIVEWIRYNCDDLENHIHLLLSCVRFPLLDLKYIMTKVEPYANTFEKSRPIFLEALRWHMFPKDRTFNMLKIYKPRNLGKIEETVTEKETEKKAIKERVTEKIEIERQEINNGKNEEQETNKEKNEEQETKIFNNNKYICFGSYQMNTAGNVEVYDKTTNRWSKNIFDVEKCCFATAIIDNKLLVIGGYLSNSKSQKSVEAYDLTTKQKSLFSEMNDDRHWFPAVVVGTDSDAVVYVFGGLYTNGYLSSAEKWDTISKKWSYIPSMQHARSGCAAALFQDKIYVAGGTTKEHRYSSFVEIYDPKKNTWEIGESIPNVNSYGTLVSTSKYLHLLGGYISDVTATSSVERYDPKTNIWSRIPDISSSGQVGGMTIDDRVVAVGGTTTIVQIYNEEKRQWENLASISDAREGFCVPIPTNANFTW